MPERADEASGPRVRDLMRRDVVTIDPDATARDLAELLARHRVGGVPVVEPGGAVAGVVSAGDLVRAAARDDAALAWCVPERTEPAGYFAPDGPGGRRMARLAQDALAGWRVRDLMTPATFSVREETTLPDLARFLLRTGTHRALVLREGRLLGIVTAGDVLRAVAGEVAPAPRADEARAVPA